jgi:hypothetical protein
MKLILKKMRAKIILFILCMFLFSCMKIRKDEQKSLETNSFNPELLSINNTENIHKARGQVIYLPVYSNIPFLDGKRNFDLSGILAFHNTDLHSDILVTRILYFHNDGFLVKDYLGTDKLLLKSLEAKQFIVPEHDKSGAGANFLVEWKSDTSVITPIIEVLMIGLTNGQGVSFTTTGKIIAEEK